MLLHIDLLHIDIFYPYLVGGLLNLIMHLFFLIQSLQLLTFCLNVIEYMANLDNALFCFYFRHH